MFRLLDLETGKFVDFPDSTRLAGYAILSHTWYPNGEQTYQDVKEIQATYFPDLHQSSSMHTATPTPSFWSDLRLSEKVRKACEVARAGGYRYIWIDSCCIDKTSSSELSEAINSMYRWYRDATVCYAFLADVPDADDPFSQHSKFRTSRWFTRGWTLQELLAPRDVIFLSTQWHVLGSKSSLASTIEDITGIDHSVLTHETQLNQVSVAKRMSWAARRETTRVEDQAYALLGMFDINMPTLYGEGERAFIRLQEEIIKTIPDQSIFAWGCEQHLPGTSSPEVDLSSAELHFSHGTLDTLFATSPSYFADSRDIVPVPYEALLNRLGYDHNLPPLEYTFTPYGMRTHFPILPINEFHHKDGIYYSEKCHFVMLACLRSLDGTINGILDYVLARPCLIESSELKLRYLRPAALTLKYSTRPPQRRNVLFLSSSYLNVHRTALRLRTVHIPYPVRAPSSSKLHSYPASGVFLVSLPAWTNAALQPSGFSVWVRSACAGPRSSLPLSIIDGELNAPYDLELHVFPSAEYPESCADVTVSAPFIEFRTHADHDADAPPSPPSSSSLSSSSNAFVNTAIWNFSHHRRFECGSVWLPRAQGGSRWRVSLGLELLSCEERRCHLRVELMDGWSPQWLERLVNQHEIDRLKEERAAQYKEEDKDSDLDMSEIQLKELIKVGAARMWVGLGEAAAQLARRDFATAKRPPSP